MTFVSLNEMQRHVSASSTNLMLALNNTAGKKNWFPVHMRKVNAWKAADADNIPVNVLKECADQLAGVLTDTSNTSLHQVVAPICFKTATIVPGPKRNTSSLSDYHSPSTLVPVCLSPQPLHRGCHLLCTPLEPGAHMCGYCFSTSALCSSPPSHST